MWRLHIFILKFPDLYAKIERWPYYPGVVQAPVQMTLFQINSSKYCIQNNWGWKLQNLKKELIFVFTNIKNSDSINVCLGQEEALSWYSDNNKFWQRAPCKHHTSQKETWSKFKSSKISAISASSASSCLTASHGEKAKANCSAFRYSFKKYKNKECFYLRHLTNDIGIVLHFIAS